MLEQTRLLVVIVALTVLSGLADSQGFLHAARIWRDGQLVKAELAKSAAGFVAGIFDVLALHSLFAAVWSDVR